MRRVRWLMRAEALQNYISIINSPLLLIHENKKTTYEN